MVIYIQAKALFVLFVPFVDKKPIKTLTAGRNQNPCRHSATECRTDALLHSGCFLC